MANAYIGAGIAKAGAELPDVISRRKQAETRQAMADEQLQAYRDAEPLRKSQQELQLAQAQEDLRKLQAGQLKDMTMQQFKHYKTTGDVKFINNWLDQAKDSPLGAPYQDMARFDKYTPADEAVLKEFGYNPEAAKHLDIFIGTKTDGTRVPILADTLYSMTGFTKQMTQEELTEAKEKATIARLASQGVPKPEQTYNLAKQMVAEGHAPDVKAAFELINARSGSSVPSSILERMANEIYTTEGYVGTYKDALFEANDRLKKTGTERTAERVAEELGISLVDAEKMLREQKQRTTEQKEADEVLAAKDNLNEIFDGDFFSVDFSDPSNRVKADAAGMTRIMKDNDLTFSSGQLTKINKLRQATNLVDLSSDMTEDETGIYDSMLRNVKKYMFDEADDKQVATAAYAQLTNIVRNMLFGATLPQGEIAMFNKQLGTTNLKYGPLMNQVKTAMLDIKNQLESIYQVADPYVAHYLLGTDRNQIAEIITNIDNNLADFKAPEGLDYSPIEADGKPKQRRHKDVADYFRQD